MQTFVFNLDTPSLQTGAEDCRFMAEKIIEDAANLGQLVELPEKFHLCLDASEKMIAGEPVSKRELKGLFDAVGGYFCSVDLYCKKHGGTKEQMNHAVKLLNFAKNVCEIARPIWGLELIEGEKGKV